MDTKTRYTNPLRAIFAALSNMQPALVLLLIIGVAVIVTMMLTGHISEEETKLETKKASLVQGANAPVMFSVCTITQGTQITSEMIEQRRVPESTIWNDSLTTRPNVVGRTAKHNIPMQNQIREVDLR